MKGGGERCQFRCKTETIKTKHYNFTFFLPDQQFTFIKVELKHFHKQAPITETCIAPYVEWTYDAPSAAISLPSVVPVDSRLLCAQP